MSNNKIMDTGSVKIERDNSIVQLILSRPKFLNSLTVDMYKQLEELLDKLKDDDSVRVLIIRGAGEKSFSAGTDITHFKGFTGEDGIEYERTIDRVIKKLEEFPKPTIAAVKGYAVGGGLIIATACELRYATSKTKFGAPMAKTLGNCLSLNNYSRISREIGIMPTKRMLYTGCMIFAKEAKKLGFVTDIFEEENFFEKTNEIAKTIEGNAFSTINATKIAFSRLQKNQEMNSSLDFDDIIYNVYDSECFSEGVAAHIEKRSPIWDK